jgi:hypothetical protein
MSASAERLLPVLATVTALAAGVALAVPAGRLPPPALWHLVFAVGALPMILAAMAYFTPVLTRGTGAPPRLAAAPLAALAAGVGIVLYFLHGTPALRLVSPWVALAGVAGFAAWIARRWRACLGRPHPCLAWYATALGLLALGLLAVALAPVMPEQTRALRAFHLHVNTLGFMGLTALGTLQVLLPTVAGKPDPGAGARLKSDLAWSAGGALLIAFGAAAAPPLALAGALVYAWPLARLAHAGMRHFGRALAAAGSTLPLLGAALVGVGLVVGHGLLHGMGIADGRAAIALFVVGFLLPLLSGAAGHLLPVWLRPGMQNEWHRAGRRRLAVGARLRAALLLAGALLAAGDALVGYVIGIASAFWLALGMLVVALKRN